MSSAAVDDGSGQPDSGLAANLVYLLKHAHLRLWELTAATLTSYGITGRELAVLTVVGGGEPLSQQQAANRLGVDRTTMVALLDELQGKGLLSRHPSPDDRRINIVEPTPLGRRTLRDAGAAAQAAERRFLSPLDDSTAQKLKHALRALIRDGHVDGPHD